MAEKDMIGVEHISPDRKYVFMNMDHDRWPRGAALFWGSLTGDNAPKRSFSGYTTRIDKCERYTRRELEEYRKGLESCYPFFDELKNQSLQGIRKYEDVLITIDELERLGFRNWSIMIRP